MQIKCGQCGTLHDLEKIPGVESVRCAHCGHAIGCLDMDTDPEGPGTVCEGRFDDDAEGFAAQAQEALRERMLVVCAHCNARVRVTKRLAGQVIHCTSCSKELRVPDAAAEDQVDISYLISPADVVMGQDPQKRMGWRKRASLRRRLISKKRMQLALKLTGGLILAILVGSVIRRGADSRDRDYLTREPFEDPPPAATEPDEKSAALQTTPPSAVVKTPPKTLPGPSVTLTGPAVFSTFASGGYYPAGPGRRYCTLSVRIQSPANKPLHFAPAEAARLVLDDATYPCLGEAVPDAQLPLVAKQRKVKLSPAAAVTLHLLFELPARETRGTLRIDALGELEIPLPAPATGNTSPTGRFVEVAPRNLKVLLTDPVMAAIQSAARQELQIRQNGSLLDVRIPDAEVIGQARPVGKNVYAVVLRHGPHSIEGTLRLLPDGQRIVLYLRNAPMHQMTYRRKQNGDAPATNDSTPPKDSNDRRPRFFGV